MNSPNRSHATVPNNDLWRRLDQFKLDLPGASLTFTRRLARENGWSSTFASRVVEEYKRFVYLAMTAGHEVTPSDEVDQAWHLHLTYTRSYWDELCDEVLGRPLHHGPTKGGQAEGERFEDQYERTLASYRVTFGEEPPADVWPPSDIRFDEAASYVRVNRSRRLILHKPRWMERRPMVAMGLIGAGAVTLQPLAANESTVGLGLAILFIVLFAVFTLVMVSRGASNKSRGKSSSGCGGLWGSCGGDGGGHGDDGGSSGCGGAGCGGGGCGGGGCGGG